MDDRLMAMLGEPIMMVVTVVGDGRPRIARGMGVRAAEAHLDVLVSQAQWPDTLRAMRPNGWIALTLCRPATYETYQVKGRMAEAPAEADDADQVYARAYIQRTFAHLADLGVGPRQMSSWLSPQDLRRIRFTPEITFAQTPGPGAGRLLQEPGA